MNNTVNNKPLLELIGKSIDKHSYTSYIRPIGVTTQ